MSIPIAFAFDFAKVIADKDTGFVPGNFARSGASPCSTNVEFDELDFDLIYHDGALSQDVMREVHNWRMSEVVVKGALSLVNLSCVVCRTIHEERTLRYFLGNIHPPRTIVEQRGSIFMRRGIFIDEIYWLSSVLYLKFHGPTGFTKEKYSVAISCRDGNIERTKNYSLEPGKYRFPDLHASKNAVWRIEIEGCIAYHAAAPATSGLVTA
jgi:ssDNA thymidine ADP-ribosyltransferase, DarT